MNTLKERRLTFPDIMYPMYTDPLCKPLHIIGAHIRGALYWARKIKEDGYSTSRANLMERDIDDVFANLDMLEAMGIIEESDKFRITIVVRKTCFKIRK